MGQETERKFLVKSKGWESLKLIKKVSIKQGYLSKDRNATVRVRVTDDAAFITIKGPTHNITCDEFEYEIPHADGLLLLLHCPLPHIVKSRRYVRDAHNQLWEIDAFKGVNKGLKMVEIELTSEDEVVVIPDWVGREVSHDRRYKNTYLAENKVPTE